MKYPNVRFTGMGMVNSSTVSAAVKEYYPNAKKGGAKRLALLEKVTDLDELIDFCVDGYRAWGDAVLMWAGAYKKIGNYPEEIAAAKKYVKAEIRDYLTRPTPFLTEADYNAWHKKICVELADNKKYFTEYSAYRKTAEKYKNGFTVGNAQKFLNMMMKDIYCCLRSDPAFLPNYEEYFKFCHMPLDSYILRFVDDIRYREGKPYTRAFACWSNITDYTDYMKEQEDIRDYVKKYNPTVTVLQTEFVVWPLYEDKNRA